MRIALCLFGKVGGVKGKDGQGVPVDYALCCQHYKRHIIKPNQADVFMHCWDVDLTDDLNRLYKPKNSLFEPQQIFVEDGSNRLHSRWYSTKKVVELKRDYEKRAGITYDWVMLGRYDLMWLVNFDFSTLEAGYFYAAVWNAPWRYRKKAGRKVAVPPDRINRSLYRKQLADLWFVAETQVIDKFSRCYDNIHEFGASGHGASWKQANRILGTPNRIKYIYYRSFDFELYRWRVAKQYA